MLLLKLVKRTFSPPLILPFLCLMELEINVVLLVYLLHSITGDVSTSLVGSISVKIYSALNLSLNKKKKKDIRQGETQKRKKVDFGSKSCFQHHLKCVFLMWLLRLMQVFIS